MFIFCAHCFYDVIFFKIMVLGEFGVGRYSTTKRYVDNYFAEEYYPTIDCNYQKKMTLDEEVFFLRIF